jgi:hypothetical protein
MLVVLVILSVLVSLSLAGLAGAQQRGKIEKTKSTIRKLNEIVMSHYEGYLRRRVAFTASSNRVTAARNRLLAVRILMAQELPDQWADVYPCVTLSGTTYKDESSAIVPFDERLRPTMPVMSVNIPNATVVTATQTITISSPPPPKKFTKVTLSNTPTVTGPDILTFSFTNSVVKALPRNATGPTRAYGNYAGSLTDRTPPLTTRYQGSECLWMIIMRGGLSAEGAIEHFRDDEQGDRDKDNALEFWDGWGRPIDFIRWPAGFSSIVQPQNASTNPDPFDPLRVSGTVNFPGLNQRDYALIPLIYSPGPDEATNTEDPLSGDGYGINSGTGQVNSISGGYAGWIQALTVTSTSGTLTTRLNTSGTLAAGTITNAPAAVDNIFNHDLMKK